MFDKLDKLKARYEDVTHLLGDPSVIADHDRYRSLAKERSDLQETVRVYENYLKVKKDIEGNRAILEEANDSDLHSIAESELKELEQTAANLERELKAL